MAEDVEDELRGVLRVVAEVQSQRAPDDV